MKTVLQSVAQLHSGYSYAAANTALRIGCGSSTGRCQRERFSATIPRTSDFAWAATFLGFSRPFTEPMYFRARSSRVFALRGAPCRDSAKAAMPSRNSAKSSRLVGHACFLFAFVFMGQAALLLSGCLINDSAGIPRSLWSR